MTPELTVQDKAVLLELARRSILKAFRPEAELPDCTGLSPAARSDRGVFVTLHTSSGALRGCIGEILPRRPLPEGVAERARNAAFDDPRFPDVTERELADLVLEISVLTPPRKVSSWKEIRIGEDGIILTKGRFQAVFLPQVPAEEKWDLETTLTYLAMKAGLPADGWKEGAVFHVFNAEVFGERE